MYIIGQLGPPVGPLLPQGTGGPLKACACGRTLDAVWALGREHVGQGGGSWWLQGRGPAAQGAQRVSRPGSSLPRRSEESLGGLSADGSAAPLALP